MKITEEQLLELEDQVAKTVIDFHSKNVVAENFNVSDFTNVVLLAGPHQPVTFSDGIVETESRFIDDIRYAIAAAGINQAFQFNPLTYLSEPMACILGIGKYRVCKLLA